MSKKSIKRNYIYNVSYQLLLLLLPFITTPYLSRVLGPDGIGLNSYASSIVSYFTLFACLGTNTYGQRVISYNQEDKEERSKFFWNTFIFRLVMVMITLILYGVYILINKENMIIFLILSLNIINVAFDITWFFQGLEEFGRTIFKNLIIKIINILFIFLFINNQNDLVIYILGTSILSIIGSLILWIQLPKYVSKVKNINPFSDFKIIIRLFIPTIAVQVYTILDKTMLGCFCGGSYLENGYYEQTEKVVKLCLTIVTSLGTVMIPRIGKTYREGDHEKIKKYLLRSYRFVFFIGVPIMLGIVVISSIFVPIFFGSGYEKVAILLPILSTLTIIIGLSNVNGFQYFIPTGNENMYTKTVVSGGITNLILNLLLIPSYFSIGACIATVLAEFVVTVTGLLYMQKKNIVDIKKIICLSYKYLLAGFVMFCVTLFVKTFLSVNLFSLVILILLGIIIYFSLLLILKDEFFIELLNKLLNILNDRIVILKGVRKK